MGLIQDVGKGPVALDTPVFIYWIEEDDRYAPVLDPLFQAVDGGRLQAVTSSLTLLEVLVVPYRAGNLALAGRYEMLLARSRGLRLADLSLPVLRAAAKLRATHPSLRTPDALQLATALFAGCTSLVTNDRRFPQMPGLRVLQLDRYLPREKG